MSRTGAHAEKVVSGAKRRVQGRRGETAGDDPGVGEGETGSGARHDPLGDDDRRHIQDLFETEVVPKLTRLGARLGALGCGFAGERYRNWTLRFASAGSDFVISDFEYDANGDSLDLDI